MTRRALIKGCLGRLILALLQLLVKERAGLGIPFVGLEAVEKELLVVGADTSLGGIKSLLLLLDGSRLVLGVSATAHGIHSGTNGVVSDR